MGSRAANGSAPDWSTALSATTAEHISLRGYDLAQLIGTVPFPAVVHLLYTGELPDAATARLIDAVMVASIDHGAGAPSVLAARTAISGGATLQAGAAAGLLTLGEHHGAAVDAARDVLESVLDTVVAGSGSGFGLPGEAHGARPTPREQAAADKAGHRYPTLVHEQTGTAKQAVVDGGAAVDAAGAGDETSTAPPDRPTAVAAPDLAAAADGVVAAVRAEGRRIAGFGHRQHREQDPRLDRLFGLAREAGVPGWHLAAAEAIEGALGRSVGRPVPINIDGATAAVLGEVGFPRDLGNALFIAARLAGVLAHANEERQTMSPMRRIDPVRHAYAGPDPRELP
jgi:citrate synthase